MSYYYLQADVESSIGIPMEPIVREVRTSIEECGVGDASTTPDDEENPDALPQELHFALFLEDYINNASPRDATLLYRMGYPFEGHPTIRFAQLYHQLLRASSNLGTRPPD
jgi:hypothetical protein